ncbi:MAG: YbaK/EbsC family protein [Patescibacteria group bacterium]|jgi:prolyl-tRNA editing enzyme YbaK/EbsC (Cys-tRNA(Pro) deacylase)
MTDKKKIFPIALKKYLTAHSVNSKILEHKTVYTAIDVANTLKKKMEEIVKSLLVKVDNYYYIVCLPADHNLDFKKIKSAIERTTGVKVKTIKIPDEKTMIKVLKLQKEGMSAFGGLYKLPVIVEKKLASIKRAVFSTGTFNHSVELGLKDFIKLENAVLASFGIKKKVKVINKRSSSSLMMKHANKKPMATKKKAVKKAVKKAKKPVKKAKKAVKKVKKATKKAKKAKK